MADRTNDRPADAPRRRLLQAGAGVAALSALPGASVLAQGSFDWKRFKGEKIEVLLAKSPRGDLLSKYHKEFEELTGIEVGSEMMPEQQQRQKAVIEFNSGNPSFDVIALSYHVQKRQFAQEQLARPTCGRTSTTSRWPRRTSISATSPRAACSTPSRPTAGSMTPAVQPRPLGRLLEQGALRRQGRRVSDELRRDDRCGGQGSHDPGKGICRLRRPRPEERQRAGVDQLPAGLRRRLHRRRGQAASPTGRRRSRRPRCTRR